MTQSYYDSRCGPGSLFARTFRGLFHQRLTIPPLDGPGAEEALSDLDPERRFEYAHRVLRDVRCPGLDIPPPLLEGVFGFPGRRFSEEFPPARWLLRTLDQAFWRHRRDGGCATLPHR